MKKIFLSLIMCIFLVVPSYAWEGIEFINIDIYVDEQGDASVTEVWCCEAYSGTEWYHPYYNLENAKISNLSVSENGKDYKVLADWNPNFSRDYKTEKCGFNELIDGVEICWGMGSYGKHTYEVKYTITNFVDNLNDSQMIYWTLLPHNMSDKVNNATIKIHTDKRFGNDVEVWGFGETGGICRVNDGYIEMNSKNGKDQNEYMTILVKLPKGFFKSDNNNDKTFDDYYNMAIKGSNVQRVNSTMDKVMNFLLNNPLGMACFIAFFYVIGICFSLIISSIFGGYIKGIDKIVHNKGLAAFGGLVVFYFVLILSQHIGFGFILVITIIGIILDIRIKEKKVIRGIIRKSHVDYYRDIPCNKNLLEAYYIAYQYGIIHKETDLLGALILKWIKEEKASVLDKDANYKKDSIKLNWAHVHETWDNENEKQLYRMMFEASGDGILEKRELKKWCRKKYKALFTWFDSVMSYVQSDLIADGEIILDKNGSRVKHIATDTLLNKGKQIAGLKKYLEDFTLIQEREAIEVHLFEDYLIMAQMLGIAKKVAKQFKELYPDVIETSKLSYSDYVFVRSISYRGIRSAKSARTSANMRSSGGGGGGSHGGGRGGGGRR